MPLSYTVERLRFLLCRPCCIHLSGAYSEKSLAQGCDRIVLGVRYLYKGLLVVASGDFVCALLGHAGAHSLSPVGSARYLSRVQPITSPS